MIIPDTNFEELFDIQLDINHELETKLTKAQEEIKLLREHLTLISSQPTIEYGSHAALKICVIQARKALNKLKEHNK